MTIVAPSLLSANFARLGQEVKRVEAAGAEWLHLDIMDGHFVPNLTIGPQVAADIRKETGLIMDVHLMIEHPDQYIPSFIEAGADLITVHSEACRHLHRTITLIKELGAKAGVALNPATPSLVLTDIIEDLDLVLIMSVNPGFGGQKFIPGVLSKIVQVKTMLNSINSRADLQIDGGINAQTGKLAVQAGCNVLVSGSYVFGHEDIQYAIDSLRFPF